MAVAALRDQRQHPLFVSDIRDAVFHMTVKTGGDASIRFLSELFAMDALTVVRELFRMTSGTERRDVFSSRARSAVPRAVDVMRAMAGLAVRRHGISCRQRAAVDAQFVFLGLFLRSTFPAEEMATAAVHFQDLLVGVVGDVKMTFYAVKSAMHGLSEGSSVNMSPHVFLSMTGQAVFLGKCCSCYHKARYENNQEGANHAFNIAEN
jgi:hypothetical protein